MCSNFYQYIYQFVDICRRSTSSGEFHVLPFCQSVRRATKKKRVIMVPHILFCDKFSETSSSSGWNFKPRLCKKKKIILTRRRIDAAVVVQCLFAQENFRETVECDVKRATGTSALTSGLYLDCRFSVARGHRAPTAQAPLLHNRAETSGI